MIEKYYKYKIEYKDFVLLIKCGNFYEVIGNDALIIKNIFGYKLKQISSNFKCGFPLSGIKKVITHLQASSINYVIIEDKVIDACDYKEKNNYSVYEFDSNKIILNYIRIDRITTFLNDNVTSNNIENILNEMEKLI